MTNFERIKAMSVGEMTEWLDSFDFTECNCCAYTNSNCHNVSCEDGHKQWLGSEVEEE